MVIGLSRHLPGTQRSKAAVIFTRLLVSLFFAVGAMSCTGGSSTTELANDSPPASNTTKQGLDSSTATLEQVLERTRAAMGEIASYKTRGTTVQDTSAEDEVGTSDMFTEWRFPDRYRLQFSQFDTDTGQKVDTELRFIGNRIFVYNAEDGWVEQPEGSDSGEPDDLFRAHMEHLEDYDIRLVFSDEVTADGARVYRLEYGEVSGLSARDGDTEFDGAKQAHTVLLIDQETFLYVTVVALIVNQ